MEQPRRKTAASAIAITLVIGIIGLTTVTSRPRFAGYATVDVLQLLACGMCFGIALVGIVRSFRGSGGM